MHLAGVDFQVHESGLVNDHLFIEVRMAQAHAEVHVIVDHDCKLDLEEGASLDGVQPCFLGLVLLVNLEEVELLHLSESVNAEVHQGESHQLGEAQVLLLNLKQVLLHHEALPVRRSGFDVAEGLDLVDVAELVYQDAFLRVNAVNLLGLVEANDGGE